MRDDRDTLRALRGCPATSNKEKTRMTSIPDNHIRALTDDELEIVGGGSLLPIPPYQGGPVHTPIIGTGMGTPLPEPLIPMPKSGPLM
jgi:hypothetical protein